MADTIDPNPGAQTLPLEPYQPHFSLVGLGASAGGIQALKTFFKGVPSNSGMAFVVVVHLASEYESNLAQILQWQTSMPVLQVTESAPR
jgi:two-component system, chemotaxis family, CheB/CheR fusion protein